MTQEQWNTLTHHHDPILLAFEWVKTSVMSISDFRQFVILTQIVKFADK